MHNPVTVTKRKFDGTAKPDWVGDLVDAVGDRWLVVYHPDTGYHTTAGELVPHALRYYGMDCPLSILVCFDRLGNIIEYQCDAALPAEIHGRHITFVDLDLDVMADAALRYHTRDEEVFALRSVAMAYPPEVIAAAHAGIGLAIDLLESRAMPFDGSASGILGRVLAALGPL
jgi:protein associated with RNAse G/E